MDKKYVNLFWNKVNKTDSCWLWTGALNEKGYGIAWDGEHTQKAHRVSWMLEHGSMPGLCVLHKCDVPNCVNPDHLFTGTRSDNNVDMVNKGRHVKGGTHILTINAKYERGERHHNSKLVEKDIVNIRADRATGQYSYSQLAEKYHIGIMTAYKVVNRKTWAHVK